MLVLEKDKIQGHEFFIRNKTMRHTADGIWTRKLSENANLITKGSLSFLDRDVSTNVFGMHALQTTGYAEISYNRHWQKHNLVAGVNYNGDKLDIRQPDSSHLTNRQVYTFGAFLQDDWKLTSRLTAQAGIRADGYHDNFGKEPFVLPRLSFKYTFNSQLTARAGGGFGYKTPNVFNTEIDERDYRLLTDIGEAVKAEKSSGINGDLNFHKKMGGWSLNINQAFYFTTIKDPLLYRLNNGLLELYNEKGNINSSGAETYVMAKHHSWEYYFGYTFTDAKRNYNKVNPYVPLTARHKFAALISTEIGDNFRTGIESSFVGSQFLDNGSQTKSYVMMAFMMRYNAGIFSFVLNGENLLDYRQSKQEPVVFPPYNNPSFPELWAPLDGRVINLSVQIKW
jgi:iron complex outermembrane receptor protein/outer membrane receptor for ferrienterochelin and colicins